MRSALSAETDFPAPHQIHVPKKERMKPAGLSPAILIRSYHHKTQLLSQPKKMPRPESLP
jgi:hypothetical protein